ncbi:hypothetical protein BE221DRAFT_77208 [Ostreococcus tauri]|uniref:Sfi1 spindle body n=1 Tax=Ostreococcus tauri TaxID=70448 RepID=A0A1Y5IEC1_OSTTA|nr:hypothetical protein BE221DRAFT_77208 [Ostreococcus tauri]
MSPVGMNTLREGVLVRLRDPSTGRLRAFVSVDSEECDLGAVRGALRVRDEGVREESGDAAATFEVFEETVCEDDVPMTTYYGFAHGPTGLMLQRKKRGLDKLAFCSNKFGVNEQFRAIDLEHGIVRLINRRCPGTFDVKIEIVGSAATASGSEERCVRVLSGDASTVEVEAGFDRMMRIVREHQTSTHAFEVLSRHFMAISDEKKIRRIFEAWRKHTSATRAHSRLVRRSAVFRGERVVMIVRRVFKEWREMSARAKIVAIKADEKFTKLKAQLAWEYFNAWRIRIARDKWCHLAAATFVRKSERQRARVVVGAWQREAQRLKIDREKRRRADRMMLELTNRKLYVAFYSWRGAAHASRELHAKACQSVARLSSRLMFKAFVEWRSVMDDARAERRRGQKAMLWSFASAQRRAFASWVECVREQKRLRRIIARCIDRRKTILLKTVFDTWREARDQTQSRLVYLEKYILHWKQRRLRHAFRVWIEGIAHMKYARSQAECIREKIQEKSKAALLMLSFWEWVQITEQGRRRRLIEQHDRDALGERYELYVRIKSTRMMRSAFVSWYKFAEVQKYQRSTLSWCLNRMTSRLLFKAFNVWMQEVENRKRECELMRSTLMRASNQVISRSFNAWRAATGEAINAKINLRKMEKIINLQAKYAAKERLRRVFVIWRDHAASFCHQRQMAAKTIASMRNRVLTSAFERWRESTKEYAQQRRMLTHIAQKMQRNSLRLAFDTWAVVAHDAKRVLFTAFNTWHEQVCTKKRYHAIIARFYERFRDRSLRGTFSTWVAVTREAKEHRLAIINGEKLRENKLAQLIGSASRRTMGYAFMEWRDRVRENKAIKVNEIKADRMVVRSRMRSLSRTFDQWLSFVHLRRRTVEMARIFVKRAERAHLAAAFGGWLDVVKVRKRNRALVTKSLQRMRHRLAVNAFYSWLEYVEATRAERSSERRIAHLVSSSLAKLQNRTMSRAFNAWYYRTTEHKRHLILVTKSLHRMRHRVLSETFAGWFSQVVILRRQKELVATSLQRMRRRVLFKAFNGWASYVRQLQSFRVVERRLQNVERAVAPLSVTHSSMQDMLRVNMAIRWGTARNTRIHRNPTFVAWLDYSRRMTAHRNCTVMKMHDILADRARRKFFFAWRQFVEVLKYRRLRIEYKRKCMIRKVFAKWKSNGQMPDDVPRSLSVAKVERVEPISAHWDFNKSYEENVRTLTQGRAAQPMSPIAHGSRYFTPAGSPVTIRPTVVEPDSYERQYRAVEALAQVRESLQTRFDILTRDEMLKTTYARATTASEALLRETRTYYSERRFSEPFSPVKASRM